ncbi:MAG: 1-(5-phosphoribosyl)-5-[(5-phosphoribosylamino)methylideneamino]imidazole-4-carboxamide isomerase [Chloroflexi bacterium]|nr:1-(5-phosphoribosyl)-5-[(5-phosphoribosylamino)methylideneamino]imidazole-4-carboxamide isomerase [Chloroflexota bacterium]MCH8897383.1 1-(5-phosphoribosyl)-5-[(5-phosphoribosylamino)methylideneamino]imidazole-4-carboxamide isomerase [Chloroflexota bacterium]
MEVIPSIDLKSGRCVRLYQGDYQQETVYSEDPISVASTWQEQGASRLHLVDLDGAAQGNPANLEIISAIVSRLTIPVQVGGGIRELATAEKLFSLGVDRVVIGTAAVENPRLVQELCQRHGVQRVVVALDARDGQIAIKGWTEETSVSVLELANDMAQLGVCRLLYTDIARDGTLTEPNFAANRNLVENTGLAVQASGGIASLDHINRLSQTGVEGVILGRALYTGDIKLAEAIATASNPT